MATKAGNTARRASSLESLDLKKKGQFRNWHPELGPPDPELESKKKLRTEAGAEVLATKECGQLDPR